jgi:hypothetical protein
VKFYKKHQLKGDLSYIQVTSDFVLGLYERSRLAKDQEKDIILEQVKLFSEHLNEYIEKPNKITLLKK